MVGGIVMNISSIGYYIIQEKEDSIEEVAFFNGDFFYLIAADEKRSIDEIFRCQSGSRFQIQDLHALRELKTENAALREANATFDKRWRKYADDLEKEHEEELKNTEHNLKYWSDRCLEEANKVETLQKKYDKLSADYDKLFGIAPVKLPAAA